MLSNNSMHGSSYHFWTGTSQSAISGAWTPYEIFPEFHVTFVHRFTLRGSVAPSFLFSTGVAISTVRTDHVAWWAVMPVKPKAAILKVLAVPPAWLSFALLCIFSATTTLLKLVLCVFAFGRWWVFFPSTVRSSMVFLIRFWANWGSSNLGSVNCYPICHVQQSAGMSLKDQCSQQGLKPLPFPVFLYARCPILNPTKSILSVQGSIIANMSFMLWQISRNKAYWCDHHLKLQQCFLLHSYF